MAGAKKKLTIADLVAKKTEKEKKKHESKPFYVESLGGEVLLERPEDDVILKALDTFKDESLSSIMEGYIFLIYNSVALFRNPELHKEYEVLDPLDIVSKLLELSERMEMGEEILKMTRMQSVGEDLKN